MKQFYTVARKTCNRPQRYSRSSCWHGHQHSPAHRTPPLPLALPPAAVHLRIEAVRPALSAYCPHPTFDTLLCTKGEMTTTPRITRFTAVWTLISLVLLTLNLRAAITGIPPVLGVLEDKFGLTGV